jgi:hypothetical protein
MSHRYRTECTFKRRTVPVDERGFVPESEDREMNKEVKDVIKERRGVKGLL